jgi:hypothetical protein
MTVYAVDSLALYVGNREINGFGEGGVLEIAKTSELWENKACTDGTVISSKILDKSGSCTLTLRYDSPGNQILQRLAEARSSVTFLCQWPNGDYVQCDECRVQAYPSITDGQSPGDRTWGLFLAEADYQFAGGV